MLCVRAAARKSSPVAVAIWEKALDFQSRAKLGAVDGKEESRWTILEECWVCRQVLVR